MRGSVALLGHLGAAGALVALAVIATVRWPFRTSVPARGLEPAIGVELGSLCDACTFGMAPVIPPPSSPSMRTVAF
jgi:hypothetical protein